jgi:phage-related minor tail protein
MMRAAELEVLFTANTADVDKAEKDVKAAGKRIESKKIEATVDANSKPAIEGLEDVEQAAKKLVSKDVIVKVDAEVSKAEADADKLRQKLDYLNAIKTDVEVTADIARAEAQLSRVDRSLSALRSARAEMTVDADISPAEDAFEEASESASESGGDAGKNFGVSIVAALATIPIVGAVIGVGKAAADALLDAFNDGLQQEKGFDRLQGLTGISEKDALRFGRSASEAYANGFGESIAQNMDTTRLGLQFDLIDPEATNRDAQKVVSGLAGIADVLGEDVQPIATATATLLRTGLAKSADEVFDLLATGAREGVNRSEDLLDTFTEYPALFQRLGLSGEEALGLINQGLEGGARNSDLAADALKEFQIRATDGSTTSAAGFEALGLSAEEMTAKIAAGGESAKEGLDQVLDGLRAIEDPVARNAAAVALFGTQAEDLGSALFNLDLSTAVEQLNGVQGAAQRMFDTLADNDASSIEQAQRNIEVAMDGIKGALAAGLSDPIADAAKFISENRGPMLQFFLDLGNGALDFGDTLIEAAADGTEAFGEFTSGPLADMVEGIAGAIDVLNGFEGRPKELDDLADSMRGFDENTEAAADRIRNLHDGIDEAREGFNDFGEGAVAMGYLNDASLRLAESVDAVGYSLDGTTPLIDAYTTAQDGSVQAGAELEGQIRNSIAALGDEISAAAATGEAQEALTGRYNTATDALVGQLTQMGLTEGQARSLIDTVLQTPESRTTAFNSNAPEQQGKVQSLADRIVTLPNGDVVITADASQAYATTDSVVRYINSRAATITVNATNPNIGFGLGDGRANGGAIYGPGGPRDDKAGLFRLSNGEHVLDSEDVRRMGGQAAVYRFRQMLDSGNIPGFADGGQISVPGSTWRSRQPRPVKASSTRRKSSSREPTTRTTRTAWCATRSAPCRRRSA